MAKKIRFPLEMEQGAEVRSLGELRDHFSLARVLVYVSNGKLVTWLRDRYIDDIADAIESLDTNDYDLPKKVCEIFDVEYDEKSAIDLEKAEERSRKLGILKEYTTEQKFLDAVDNVAFTQDDVYDLLDDGQTSIYLCGDQFTIPLSKKGMTYIGINNPIVVVDSKKKVDWEEKNITLSGVRYDSAYQHILDELEKKRSEKQACESTVEKVVFKMPIEDVFSITGRGTVVGGQIEDGKISIGDKVTLRKLDGSCKAVEITSIESFRRICDFAQKGDRVGILIKGVSKEEVDPGDVLEHIVNQKSHYWNEELSNFMSVLEQITNQKSRGLDFASGAKDSVIGIGSYSKNSYLNFMLSPKDKAGAEKCFNALAGELNRLNYDIDTDVSDVRQRLMNEGLAGLANNYIESL